MPDPQLLELSAQSLTADKLEIKVKNVSGAALDQTLAIDIYPPAHLVSKPVRDKAVAAATSQKPIGAASLAGIVTCPQGWTAWAKRETSDASLIIGLFNDMNQSAELVTPVALAAGAEFTIGIPLNPEADRTSVTIPYGYQHGTEETDKHYDGKLELKSGASTWTPDVKLNVNHNTPTMIPGGALVKISWSVKDGVSATLRGPLPGGNTEYILSSNPKAEFKIVGGTLEVRVVGAMHYVLRAEVTRPDGQPNVEVTRTLSLDIANEKYTYLNSRTITVLPNGLIEIDWAAWGVKQVKIDVTGHTTRVIKLTQQNLGRFFEGTGVMRVSARKSLEVITLNAQPVLDRPKQRTVTVTTWEKMLKPQIGRNPLGLAVIAPKLAALTSEGLYIADVGIIDSEDEVKQLMFVKPVESRTVLQYFALTALEKRFVLLSRSGIDFDVAAYTINGKLDDIPPVTLPPEVRNLALGHKHIDFVGFSERVYLVFEAPQSGGMGRRAFSIGFNSNTNKADLRSEPLLDSLVGYHLVTFDGGLYALNRETGHMLRFNLTTAGMLDKPLEAASAVKKNESSGREESMVTQGLLVPVGRVLVVMNPTSFPSIAALDDQGLKNTMPYESSGTSGDPNRIPQDLVYNPQRNYWARCGHDLDVKPDTVVTFRDIDSPRLWAIQPDGEAYTLAVGDESLFAPNYRFEVRTKPLPPYFNKKRQFRIDFVDFGVTSVEIKYNWAGMLDFVPSGPVALTGEFPKKPTTSFSFELEYNEAHVTPVTLRLQRFRQRQSRDDTDYLAEVTLSGPNFSTATSLVRRVVQTPQKVFFHDEIVGTRTQHLTDKPIEVKRPARFDEQFKLVIVNASKQFRLKPKGLRDINSIADQAVITTNHDMPDFSLTYEGNVPTEGEVAVTLNFALPTGIEVSSSTGKQTKLIRIGNNNAKKIQILLVKLLMPGDPALNLQGAPGLIVAVDGPLLVCHLDYKP